MTIIIDIKPEVQAELSRQAAAHGVDIGAYAASLLEEAAHIPAGAKTLSQSQLDTHASGACAVLAQDSLASG